VPLIGGSNAENIRYLQTKEDRMGHLLSVDEGKIAEENE